MRVWREPALWFLAAVVLLFFWRPLTIETFCYRDLYLLFYPKKLFLLQALGSGQIPLWDPLTHGGQPYLASPSNTFYYPANLLYAILPPLQAFNTIIVLHVILCASTAYLLARILGLSQPAAFVSGAVFALCGYTLSTINLMVLVFALPWVPLTLAATHLFVTTSKARYLVTACIAAALPLLAGAAELTAMMFVTLASWLAVVPNEVPLRRRALTLLAVCAFAIGLSMALTVPAAEMIRESSRREPRPFEDFGAWSVSPRRLPELIVPRFFGLTDVPDDSAYWGGRFERQFPYILSLYFGVCALVLAAVAVLTTRGHPERRVILLLLALAALGLILSLGTHLPLFRLAYEIPGARNFRYPVKAMMISLVPLALLAGFGVQRLEEGRARAAAILAGAAALVFLILAGVFSVSSGFRQAFASSVFLTALTESSQRELAASLFHTGSFATLFALVAGAAPTRSRIGPLVAALVVFDLALAGSRVNFYAPREVFEKPPLADAVRSIIDGGRLYRESFTLQRFGLPDPHPAWTIRWMIETLAVYTGNFFGLPAVLHADYDGLAPLRMTTLTSRLETMPWNERAPALARAGVTAVISRRQLGDPLKRTLTMKDADGHPLHLYANPVSRPIRFATRPRFVSDDKEALQAVLGTPYSPDEVILQGNGARVLPRQGCRSRVVPRRRAINETIVDVETSCDGFVVFSETFYPGWTASVDGAAQNLLRADFAFSAVAVPAGNHVVRKAYRPVSVPIGLAGTGLSLLALGIVAWRLKR